MLANPLAFRHLHHIIAVFVAGVLYMAAPTFTAAQTCGGPTCVTPTTIASGPSGVYGTTYVEFNESISNTSGNSFDGYIVQEAIGGVGSNSCYWAGSTLTQHPNISGGTWTVGGGDPTGVDAAQGPPTHNTWGYDVVGTSAAQINYIRSQGPAHGVSLPCTYIIYQNMLIASCSDGSEYQYATANTLTIQVGPNFVRDTRRGSGQTIAY